MFSLVTPRTVTKLYIMKNIKVLFVCMGNICRSPTAQGVFSRLVRERGLQERISSDSAGTHSYHVGDAPDGRAQAAAKKRDIDISNLRARQVSSGDFHEFDYILAMDRDNYHILISQCPERLRRKVRLFLEFASQVPERDVPDPYFGGDKGFDRVLDMVEFAATGLLEVIREQHP